MQHNVKQAPAITATQMSGHWDFIDGLRAIAVLAVVLYHAGLPGISGGYVGVDVFFVISGYLIINQIMVQRERGTFSFSEFWSRRAIRILPPYFLVIGTCAAIAPFILVMPNEFEAFANEIAYSALMVVNHLFLEQQGYFDRGSDTKVLLHLWSLAVEEQFYIVAPVLIAVLWRLRARLFGVMAALIFALSFVACIYLTTHAGDKNYAFFVMPLRAWEFIAGGAIAAFVPFVARWPRLAIEGLALAGLAAILYAVLTFTNRTPFPSYWAAIPVFGSCALILSGLAGPSLTRHALAIRPMRYIGLISYSWYLWHWPLLVFGRIYNFGEYIPSFDALMVALSFILAVATYLLLEKPLRVAREKRGRPLGWSPTWAGVVVCVVASLGGYWTFTHRAESISSSLAGTMLPHRPGSAGPCDLRVSQSLDQCKARFANMPIGVLIGDSQAASATRALVKATSDRDAGLMAVASGGCISLLTGTTNIPSSAMAENCRFYRANATSLLATVEPDFAILYSYWTMYIDPKTAYYFLNDEGERAVDQREVFLTEFAKTADYLRGLGISRILVLGPTPSFPRSAPECVNLSLHYGMNPDVKCSQPREAEDARRELALDWLNAAVEGQEDIRLLDPIDTFCDDVHCRSYEPGSVLFNDTNHISDAGVEAILSRHPSTLDWIIGR